MSQISSCYSFWWWRLCISKAADTEHSVQCNRIVGGKAQRYRLQRANWKMTDCDKSRGGVEVILWARRSHSFVRESRGSTAPHGHLEERHQLQLFLEAWERERFSCKERHQKGILIAPLLLPIHPSYAHTHTHTHTHTLTRCASF